MSIRLIEVLLVEDDLGDIELTKETLRASKLRLNLNVVRNGVEAMDFLNTKKPDLILLDLNMPRMDGKETLRAIKGDERFKHIPVVILTTSRAEADVFSSYFEGANCYISKPVGMDEFEKVIKGIEDFWFTIVKLPKKH